jgi:spore coat polysaccharide biosynthesis protein SpsF
MTVTAAIIQARLGSSRLPGKVLKPLSGGATVLEHVVRRVQAMTESDVVCVATSDLPLDDVVAAEASRLGAVVVRGPEHDVLRRFALAAQTVAADIVLRITCDCPLIDPEICDELVRLRRATNANYASVETSLGWPHGLDCEVITREALDRADRLATTAYDREHVTSWIYNGGTNAKVGLPAPEDLRNYRWVLDYPEDYEFLRALFRLLPALPKLLSWQEVRRIVDAHPEIRRPGPEQFGTAG